MMMRNKIIEIIGCLDSSQPLIYISGKVTGLPPMEVAIKFGTAERKLRGLYYETFNPTAWLSSQADWQEAMKLCISILPICDGIFLLPDWHESTGAKIERDTALLLGIPTIEL